MERFCKDCGKRLNSTCDFCHSLNVRPSRTSPGTLNCGNCFRRDMPRGAKELITCHECEHRNRKLSERHGELK